MEPNQRGVTAARLASARADGVDVRAALAEVQDLDSLTAADLEDFASSLWWLGDVPGSMSLGERVFRKLEDEERHREAAMVALRLALQWGLRADLSLYRAWTARARRLLAPIPEGPEHGHLAYLEAAFDLSEVGAQDAAEAAAGVAALARRHSAEPLQTFALVLEGHSLVLGGHTDRGFARLDEAMLPVLAGAVEPLWGGDVYCAVIHLCHQLGDFGRMRAWTDSFRTWSARLSTSFMFHSVTRLHDLELLVAEGDWDRALSELGATSASLENAQRWLSAEGFALLGDVLRLRGLRGEAATAYARARAAGGGAQPGFAYSEADAGRLAEALDSLRAELAGVSGLGRARLLLAAVELGLRNGNGDAARLWAEELGRTAERFTTGGLRAWAEHARALVALDASDGRKAVEAATAAVSHYRAEHLRHGLGRAHELLADALDTAGGDAPAARAEAAAERATALAIYRQLGAAPDADRLGHQGRPTGVGPLTPRETEVLRHAMGGGSNRDIAAALVLSERTVGRHLANIFAKLGVASRTGAAAWARDAGLRPPGHFDASFL